MSQEPDLRRGLLKEEASRRTDGGGPSRAAAATLRRERRRIAVWATVTVLAWILVGAYCTANVMVYLMFFHPKLTHALAEHPDNEAGTLHFMRMLADYLYYANVIWPIVLTLAAVVTVTFILKSRRATLRQIQHHLAEISVQIRALAAESQGPAQT